MSAATEYSSDTGTHLFDLVFSVKFGGFYSTLVIICNIFGLLLRVSVLFSYCASWEFLLHSHGKTETLHK